MGHSYTDIKDLLGLMGCCHPGALSDLSEFTDWAEREVMQGNSSEKLLILASLGLDKEIDKEEVITWFRAYLNEAGISEPHGLESSLLYCRRNIKMIAYSGSEDAAFRSLDDHFSWWYDAPASMLSRIISYWRSVFDDFVRNDFDSDHEPYFECAVHMNIPVSEHGKYIISTARRFLRIFDEPYYYALLLRSN